MTTVEEAVRAVEPRDETPADWYWRLYTTHSGSGYCLPCGRHGMCPLWYEAFVWLVWREELLPAGHPDGVGT